MNMDCVVCLEILFTPGSNIYATPCGHIFHSKCLFSWISESQKCPTCNQRITIDSLKRLYIHIDELPEWDRKQQKKIERANRELELVTEELKQANRKLKQFDRQQEKLKRSVERVKVMEKENLKLRVELDELKTELASNESKLCTYMEKFKGIMAITESIQTLEGNRKLTNHDNSIPTSRHRFTLRPRNLKAK